METGLQDGGELAVGWQLQLRSKGLARIACRRPSLGSEANPMFCILPFWWDTAHSSDLEIDLWASQPGPEANYYL